MKVLVEVGTDIAALAVGDVAAIGDVLEAPNMDAWLEHRDRAISSGRLWRCDTGADGSFLICVCFNERPRSGLRRYLKDPIKVSRFTIPSGRLLVAGEESFVRPDFGNLKLGELVEVPAGEFSLTAYRGEYPDDLAENLLREEVSPRQFRLWSLGNALPAVAIVLSVVGVPLAFGTHALTPVLPAAAAWIFLAWFRGTRAYRKPQGLYRQLEREYPTIVLVFMSVSAVESDGEVRA